MVSIIFFPPQIIYLSLVFKLSVVLFLLGLFCLTFYLINLIVTKLLSPTNLFKNFLGSMWFLFYCSSVIFIPILPTGAKILKYGDQGWIEYLGGQGIYTISVMVSSFLDLLSYVNLKFYLYLYFLGFIVLIVLM